ncbi:MAG TPA: type VI secretion system baseplate subunit TssE [Planctomycetaceae bacterium]|nr:type VI secretion system baseplate subunit TssE [Planctomycetaceae bacterium]
MLSAFRDSEGFPLSLLDRLRDDRPREQAEAPGALVCSWQEYRQSILHDIQWLLNTTSLDAFGDGSPWSEIARSTLNFGVPEVCGTAAAAVPQRRWERACEQALARFEPRLREDSIRVRICPMGSGATANQTLIEISAELMVAPIPLSFRVQIDRETSAAVIQELAARAA